MKLTTMKLTELVKPEKNVRVHTEQQLREFERSVKMFGQIRPIVIDENNVILAGNGLYDTLIAMGKDTAEVYQYKNLTDRQKKKLMIADNKIFNLGVDNLDVLNCFFEELQGDLDIPGFDEEILKCMMSDAEDITEKLSEYGTLNENEIQNIKETAVKKEQKMQQNSEMIQQSGQQYIEQESEVDNEESTKGKKVVVCPNCGEKIWL